jgi:hypothetical protein
VEKGELATRQQLALTMRLEPVAKESCGAHPKNLAVDATTLKAKDRARQNRHLEFHWTAIIFLDLELSNTMHRHSCAENRDLISDVGIDLVVT